VGVTYDEFVAGRLRPLMRYAVMLTGDPHLAEDLVRDTMVRVRLKWRRVAAADPPEIYVKRTSCGSCAGRLTPGGSASIVDCAQWSAEW
jgi:hypothetical protein